jgi:hypothetical protein
VVWFSRSSTMAAAAPSGALAPRFAPAAAVQARAPPPSDDLARGSPVRWLVGSSGNGERQLGLGSNPHEETSIYWGF